MKNKKRLLLSLCCALMASTAAMGLASCKDRGGDASGIDEDSSVSTSSPIEEVFEGTGDYYTQSSDGVEYNLTVSDDKKVTLVLGGAALDGTYTYSNGTLKMTFSDSTTATATWVDGVLTLSYKGGSYRFIEKVTYTVYYNVDGSVTMMVPVLNGKKTAKPADPAKEGCVFVGWYTDAEYSQAYAFDATLVTGDITLYARFVEISVNQQEFTVSFIADDVVVATAQTVGGVVFTLPEAPEKAGATFAGWWTSDYDDPTKLTCKYDEQVLGENTKLYAVWESTGVLVSVSETGVSITAKGVNNSYKVKIADAEGNVLNGAAGGSGETTSQPNYAFDFSSKPAGDYTIEVTLNGETTTAYYCNKALDKVSNFTIEGNSVLTFNAVKNAEKYLLTVDCGNDNHNHTELDLGTSTYYNFENCEMQKGGITFTVKAVAEGYVTSTSATYSYEKNLDAVTGLAYDDANDQFVWDVVANAKSYVVEVNGVEFPASTNTYFSVKDYNAGEITIKVYPVAKGYNSSEAVSLTCNKVRLQTPTNISVSGTTVKWDTVTGAESYVVKIGDKTFPVSTNSLVLTSEHYTEGQDVCEISVSAVGATVETSSHYSETVVVRFASMADTLKYANGTVVWDFVVNADRYAVKVNGGAERTVAANVNLAPVTLTQAGWNTISVCYYDKDNNPSNWVDIEVYAYAIEFDVQGGYAIDTQYKAKGDSYELPAARAIGYDFGGWYNIPGGADENGEVLKGGVYEKDGDMVVYAYWIPKEYEVTFVVDDGSVTGTVEYEKWTVKYGQHYTLPKAVADDAAYDFGGWYANYGGVGMQYTDLNGDSLNTWNFTENQTFYVGWVKVLELTKLEGVEGYSVSQGVDIAKVTKVKIPAVYNDLPVMEIAASAFKGCEKLVEIEIPDTIQLISFTVDGPYSTGSAFQNCNALETLTMYCPDEANHGIGDHQQKYFVYDGILVENDEYVGMELQFIPKAHEAAKAGEVTVPDGVQTLPINVFSGSNFTKIVIPASVTRINAYAFAEGSKDELTTVEFLAAAEGEAELPLVIENNAFDGRRKLTAITLPARTQQMDAFSVFSDCTKLATIEIEGVSDAQVYTSKAGVLCDATGSTMLYCAPAYAGENGVFTIPAGVTTIAENAFKDCKNITELVISGQVTTIAKSAFEGCTGLKNIRFVDTDFAAPLSIAEKAFYGCTGLTELTLPRNLVGLGKYAFGHTTKLKTVTVDTDGANLNFANGAFQTEGGVGLTYVQNLTLGEKVTELAINGVFGGSIVSVNVDKNSPYYDSVDGVLFNEGVTEIVCFPAGKEIPAEGYKLPETVEVIGASVFKGKHNLTKITIGANVKRIDEEAFANAIYLAEVVFEAPETGAELVIGDKAFANCPGLNENTFKLPTRTRTIGNNAFERAVGFTTFVIPEGVTTLGDYVFSDARALRSVSIPSTVTAMGKYDENGALSSMQVFASCDNLETITVVGANTAFKSIEGILYVESEDNATELLLAPLCGKGKAVTETDGSISYVVEVPETVTKVWARAFNLNEGITKILFADSVANGGALEVGTQAFESAASLKEVKLPEGLTAIATGMFQGCAQLETVNVPASVTTIGIQAFYGCRTLKNVNFAQNRTANLTFTAAATGTGAFYGCVSLENLELPEKTTVIGAYIFQNLTRLSDVTLPSTVTQIGNYAFYNTGVTSVTIPAQVTTLGTNAFQYCDALETVVVNATSLTTIGNYAFANCGALTSVDLTAATKLTTIGNWAFSYAPMTSISLPSSLTTINQQAFYATGLTSILIPTKVKSIGANAFEKCEDLETATFEACTVTSGRATTLTLGQYMFGDCNSLTSLEIPANVTTIPANFVYYCRSLKSITFKASSSDKSKLATVTASAFKGCAIEEIAFPDYSSATKLTLNKEIFYNCQYLTKVYLSAYVQSVANVFDGCKTITEIEVSPNSTYFQSAKDSDYLLSKDGKTIAAAIGTVRPENGILVLPETVTAIGANAFKGQNYITKVVFPAALQTIGQYAFQDCLALTEVEFSKAENGDDCLLNTIDNYAFDGCTALRKVHLPHVVTTVGKYAFAECSSLTDLVLNDNLETLGQYAFNKCTSLVSVSLPASLSLTAGTHTYIFSGCTSLQSVTLHDDITTLGNYMFNGCTSLSSITLPTNLTDMGTSTFTNTALTSIIIPVGVTQFGSGTIKTSTSAAVFKNCTELTSVTFLGEITALGAASFEGCENLTTIKFSDGTKSTVTIGEGETAVTKAASLPNTLTLLGDTAFKGTALSEMIIPDSVTTLGKQVFQNCTKLETVYVPAVTAMGASLFNSCVELENINLATSITYGSDMFSDCTALTTVHLPAPAVITDKNGVSTQTLGSSMFSDCTALTTVTFDEGTTALGAFMFSGCTALTGVDEEGNETLKLPASLTNIGQDTFNNSGIVKITIPAGVTRLSTVTAAWTTTNWKTANSGTFEGCESLEKVTLLGAVEIIGASTFKGCISLKSITLPDTVKYIAQYAFQDSGIETINLEKVEHLGVQSFANSKIAEVDLSSITAFETQSIFQNCTELVKVKFSDSLTTTYSGLFNGCTKLGTEEEVKLPTSLTKISDNVFANTGIKKLTLHEGLTSISSSAFAGSQLESIHIPSTIKGAASLTIGAFANCENLATITSASTAFPVVDGLLYNPSGYLVCAPIAKEYSDGVLTIKDGGAISNSSSVSGLGDKITKVVFGTAGTASSNKTLASSAFKGWENLTEVVIGEGYTTIGANAFQDCINLKTVTLPSTLTTINNNAFDGCSSLEGINLNDTGLTTLGQYAFQDAGLKEVTLPGSLKGGMNTYVFYNNKQLKSVVIGEGVTTLNNRAFYGCEALESVTFPEESLTKIGQYVFSHTAIEELVVPESVTTVEMYAFGYMNAKKVEFKSVPTSIGTNLFYESWNLKDIILADGWTTFSKYMFSKSGIETFTIPETITKFDTYIFQNCTSLREVIIPEGVISLSANMFDGCTALTAIDLPDSLLSIGNSAFAKTGLVTVDIPDYVLSIGTNVFQGCASLTSVSLPEGFTSVPEGLFRDCPSVTEYTVSASVKEIGNYAFAGTSITSFVVPDTVKTLGSYAFQNCELLTSVKLPAGLKEIEQCTFENCKSLKSIVIPQTVHTMSTGAFKGSGITSFTLPALVTTLASSTFENCASLKTVTLHNSLVNIESKAFMNTTAIESIVIPSSIVSISYSSVFAGWTAEQTIYFEESEEAVKGYSTSTSSSIFTNSEANVVYDYKA